MSPDEQRQSERKDSLNILDYVVVGPNGEQLERGMGRTLNVSDNGLLLETNVALGEGQTLLVAVGVAEDMVELKGQVTHVEKSGENMFSSGIEFTEIDDAGRRVLKKLLEALKAADKK